MEDLQSLLEKINRDGVEKAEAEAAKIIADAKAKADEIVKAAEEKAAKTVAEAEKNAAAFADRAAVSVRQAARDTVISVQDRITGMLENLLAKNVDAALADEKTAAALVAGALEDLVSNAEIAATLKAQLAGMSEITVVTDDSAGSGFSVKLDNGRIEHSFTGETVTEELARRLRPELAALIK
jgi:V/A-type H+-transporting ATPase subunit E